MDSKWRVCPFCGAPRPDDDGSMCLAYTETWEACERGDYGTWTGCCADDARAEYDEQRAYPPERE